MANTYTILNVIMSIAVILITASLIPYLKEKKTAEEWKQILNNAQIAVNAAEQIFGHGANKEKYKYADYILKNLFGEKLNSEERMMIIENAVKEMKNLQQELLK